MSESTKDKKLFEEFPPVSTEDWEAKIKVDLKGADYERKLIWKTNNGFNIKPYYRAEDLKDISYLNVHADEFPFVRGSNKNKNSWLIRQDIKVENFYEAHKKALSYIDKGAQSIGFIIENEPTKSELNVLLENIDIEKFEINFVCAKCSLSLLQNLISLFESKNIDLKKVSGSIEFDDLGSFALKGKFQESKEALFNEYKSLIQEAQKVPKFKVIAVNGKYFNNSGSSIVEELAFSLAAGNEYLSQLTEKGLSVDEIANHVKFNFAVGSNYFLEIAKIRAARLLWANIVKAYNSKNEESEKMYVHSTTSEWNKTVYDPYVNILRSTTETMSSIIGGTDSLTVNPFNSIYEETTDFSERIARNQQIIIKEESYFDEIVDPSAGSYYIENLTNSIAENAWKLFVETEQQGGFIKALENNFIQNKINETAQKRDLAIATRKENFLGTNQFPNFNEHIDNERSSEIINRKDLSEKDAVIETLKPYRGTQGFEQLRFKTDRYSKINKRPQAFMFTFGNVGMRKARAQFACNFFACAGFDVVDNNGFSSVDEGVEACVKNKADIVVICSSDDEYANIVAEIYEKLKTNAIIVVAGYPKAIIDDLKSKGIKHFIYVKTNVLESLNNFQTELGIL
ncbi:MAG: acyl-CoA mutase large subunit family protein [Bacteroidetes bacterium]|nr:acyl-CoA mutase large subunit family protein [Bacteroidota bacterium]